MCYVPPEVGEGEARGTDQTFVAHTSHPQDRPGICNTHNVDFIRPDSTSSGPGSFLLCVLVSGTYPL